MLRKTLSNAVKEALRDETLFKINNTYTVKDVTDILQSSPYIKEIPVIYGLSSVVRRQLNKMSGYKKRKNSNYKSPRRIDYNINPDFKKTTRWGYTINYTFYEKID